MSAPSPMPREHLPIKARLARGCGVFILIGAIVAGIAAWLGATNG